MKTVTVNVPIAQSPHELAQLRAEAAAKEEQRQREALAQSNRDRDLPEPKPGSSLHVATARGLPLRARAGLTFSPTPSEVKVIDEEDAEILRRQKQGERVVNPHGAEQILADSNEPHLGLVLFGSKVDATGADLDDRSPEELEAALARVRAKRAPRDAETKISSQRKAGAENVNPNRGKPNE
jgi:hypothetical protein